MRSAAMRSSDSIAAFAIAIAVCRSPLLSCGRPQQRRPSTMWTSAPIDWRTRAAAYPAPGRKWSTMHDGNIATRSEGDAGLVCVISRAR